MDLIWHNFRRRLKGGCLLVQYQADAAFSVAKRSDFIAVLLPISCHGQYLYLHFYLQLYLSARAICICFFSASIPVSAAKDQILLPYYQPLGASS